MERDLDTDLHPYATLAYARTLAHVGRPVYVPAWRTYVIARDWQGRAEDVAGPYPLACLAADSNLEEGLEDLREAGFVSVTLVVDGLTGPPISRLKDAFTIVRPFKTHYLLDPASGAYQPSKHHRYEIRRAAQRGVEVRILPLLDILGEWIALYDELILRHEITGMQAFSDKAFEALAAREGLSTVAAFIGGELVSAHLWFQHQRFVWSHLGASNARGYASGAAYAVYDHSLHHFQGSLIDLGGAAGIDDALDDGLARFKAGFSNRTNTAYLIGGVLDPTMYEVLRAERGGAGTSDYFPAYRTPSVIEGGPHSSETLSDELATCKDPRTISR